MACTENVQQERGHSEMEEGEIVDDLDDLSDISSEEEFLLRQRLQVLENYNNVLERKKTKAKHSSVRSGIKRHNHLSEISGAEIDDFAQFTPKQRFTVFRDAIKSFQTVVDHDYPQATPPQSITVYRNTRDPRPYKPHEKHRRKEPEPPILPKNKEYRKKNYRKKRAEVKVISETSESEESEDEYRNKRRKLAEAVVVNKGKSDKTSLQARLKKMLSGNSEQIQTINQPLAIEHTILVKDSSCSPKRSIANSENEEVLSIPNSDVIMVDDEKENKREVLQCIDLSTDDDVVALLTNENIDNDKHIPNQDIIDCNAKEIAKENSEERPEEKFVEQPQEKNKNDEDKNSDDDLELLRQNALQTKSSKNVKAIAQQSMEVQKHQSEDEDSDTAELRLICLKSALLKKAIEMKQKQKLRKRLSQSIAQDDFILNENDLYENIESDNNTDIEAMDMDIGSDGDEKTKDDAALTKNAANVTNEVKDTADEQNTNKEEELDEDEDLLRARLLTSLSKNLPNLVDPTILNAIEESPVKKKTEKTEPTVTKPIIKKPAKKIIINVGESDSEGEHEATKNLTKMHMKLSEQKEFQQKLDMFLKSTRMEVEKEKLPDVVQQPQVAKTPQKFVAKAVNHLPKSEQMEYKNLVKRMAELEKIKQARQVSVTITNKWQMKDALKPSNLPNDPNIASNLEEQINLSRKKIAEESAKMLKLKEEATKLFQKYKIVATELRNISTAITLNKRQQRSAQGQLAKIRMQHQRLLNSSTSKHSNFNNHTINRPSSKVTLIDTIQKENAPTKDDYKNTEVHESLTISVANDLNEDRLEPEPRLSIEVDVTSNKKTVTTGPVMEHGFDISTGFEVRIDNDSYLEKADGRGKDDYESPLQALGRGSWEADPNAILCPFEVAGLCKDADCKYLHPKIPSH